VTATQLKRRFGQRLRELRLERGVTQEALANRADVDRAYLSRVERGIANVTLVMMWKLARVLRVEIVEMLIL